MRDKKKKLKKNTDGGRDCVFCGVCTSDPDPRYLLLKEDDPSLEWSCCPRGRKNNEGGSCYYCRKVIRSKAFTCSNLFCRVAYLIPAFISVVVVPQKQPRVIVSFFASAHCVCIVTRRFRTVNYSEAPYAGMKVPVLKKHLKDGKNLKAFLKTRSEVSSVCHMRAHVICKTD